MKTGIKFFTLLFFTFTIAFFSTVQAQDYDIERHTPCGMEYSSEMGNDIFPYKIIERDYTICDEDISYRMLHMMFGASMNSSLSKELFELFHKPSEAVLTLSEISPVGRVIRAIYEALTHLFLLIFAFVVGFQTINYIVVAQASGNFLGNNDSQKKAASVAVNALIIIMLATPVGSVILLQAIIISLSVIAIMLANFFLSAFLYNTQTETTRVEISENLLVDSSNNFSNEFLAGQLCEYQTQQAVFNDLYTSSVYNKRSSIWRFWGSTDPIERAQSCNTYSETFQTNKSGFLTSITSEIKYNACNHHHRIPNISRRDGSDYGSNHECFSLSFIQPEEDRLSTIFNNRRAIELKNEIIDEVKKDNNDFYHRFAFENIKDSVIPRTLIDGLQNAYLNENMGEVEFDELFLEKLNEQANKFRNTHLISHMPVIQNNEIVGFEHTDNSNGLLSIDRNDVLEIGNNSESFNLIYLKHLFAANKALGGYISPYVDNDYKSSRLARGGGSNWGFNKYARDLKKLHEQVAYTGVEHIRRDMYVRSAAKDMLKGNCLERIEEHWSGVRWFNRFQRDHQTMLPSSNDDLMSCIVFNSASEHNVSFQHLLRDLPIFEDMKNTRSYHNDYLPLIYENQELIIDEQKRVFDNVVVDLLELSAYHYVIKKAFADSLANELKRNADFRVLATTRAAGWGGLGPMMLAIGSEQASANTLVADIVNTGSATGYVRMNDHNLITYVNDNAFDFLSDIDERMDRTDRNVKGFYITNNLLNAGLKGGSTHLSDLDLEMTFLQRFLNTIIEFVFNEPLNYLKSGAGMDMDKSLPENLNSCSITGDCFPSDAHPMNATIMFGQSLLYNTLLSILLLNMLNGLAVMILNADLSAGDGNTGAKSGGSSNLVKSFLKFIPIGLIVNAMITIMKVIAYIITVVSPMLISMFSMLLMPAFLLGFMLPSIPYVMTVMIVLGWYITIFVMTLAFPILLLTKSKIRDDGNNELSIEFFWQKLGGIIVKPAVATIGIIFSWVLVTVSIYYINTTIFSLFAITAFGNLGFLASIIGLFVSYFVYAMVIYFILQHSFTTMLKFTDTTLSVLGVQGDQDEQNFNTLSTERMLAAHGATNQMSKGMQGMGNKMSEGGAKAGQGFNGLRDKINNKNGGDEQSGSESKQNKEPSKQDNQKQEDRRIEF